MECGFYYNLIKTLTLEEIENECSSFLHLFENKKPELILFISKFEIQVSNLIRIFNIKPLGRQTNRNSCLNELIDSTRKLFLAYLRNAGPKIQQVRHEPILPKSDQKTSQKRAWCIVFNPLVFRYTVMCDYLLLYWSSLSRYLTRFILWIEYTVYRESIK